MKKIYISGPITGTEDYMERFAAAEQHLINLGYVPINPAKINSVLPEDTTHRQYMQISMVELKMTDAIYVLQNWENSKGTCEEIAKAMERKMPVFFEGGEIPCAR